MRQIRRHKKQEDPDLTPALDVVFILLIFFIVTATFVEEQTLAMEPPLEGPPPTTDTPTIIVKLDSDGLISVNERLTDISFVRANIERLRAEQPESNLVIQAAPTAKSGALLRVRDAAYSAGYNENVGVSLLEETG